MTFIDSIRICGDFDRDEYLNDIPAIRSLKTAPIRFDAPLTFFVGENGAGKSTLIEAIAVACKFNPEGGTKNYMFSTRDTHSELWEKLRITKRGFPKWGYFLRAESFYNSASYSDSFDYMPTHFHEQSHGESFLAVLEQNIGANGLYILDEPEAALSPMRILRLMVLMHRAILNGSQFIIATHSPLLMTFPDSKLLYFGEDGVEEKPYYETDHFLISKKLMSCPQKIFEELFDGD